MLEQLKQDVGATARVQVGMSVIIRKRKRKRRRLVKKII
jgi:hypothetical protein